MAKTIIIEARAKLISISIGAIIWDVAATNYKLLRDLRRMFTLVSKTSKNFLLENR